MGVASTRRRSVAASRMFLILYGIILGSILIHSADSSSRQKRDVADDQPRIVTVGGNLVFQTGTNHNITFKAGGSGSVVLDGEDLRQLITLARENQKSIQQLQVGNVENRLRSLEVSSSFLNNTFTELKNRVIALENSLNNTDIRQLPQRVSVLEQQVRQLNLLLTANECQSNPCRNGGTCVDLFNGFSCTCISGWMGSTCETDINECATLAGSDVGCQHGATCLNTVGSFSCTCAPNWYGTRCSEAHDDCASSSNEALCSRGTCQRLSRVIPNQPKYQCHCDVGWTTDGVRPQCVIDINECNDPRPPCSTNPPVICMNTPGSFFCGPCPQGFSGNGYVCNDINECEVNNGGCSLAPRVRCINTVGSRTCDACPSGFQGDGITCSYVGVCGQNNGGCHPVATCREFSGILGRSCSCPSGYTGDGVGPGGCVLGGGACANNPCIHGTCQPNGASYTCVCSTGWTGFNCNQQINGCANNPCRNGGTCVGRPDGSFTCTCTESYTGPTCQQPQQTCGGRLTGESGSFRYPRQSSETYPHGVNCAWVITTSPNKVIVLTFPLFKLEAGLNCNADFLQIHDGPSASSHMIGKYCGTLPPNGGIINSTSYQVYLWFRSDASYSSDGFEIVWSSTVPTCGGNLRGADYGSISSPGYPGTYPDNRDCVWTVAVSPGKTIRFTFGQLALESHLNCSYDYLEVRDGLLERDPILARYCSTVQPPPVDTTGPYAVVRFHSDDSRTDRGFLISYSALQGCGGTYTADSGVLISPNYPNPYPHNAQCIWIISVPEGEVITFAITNIDLEVHSNCYWDFVELREGLDERGRFLGRFCGNSTPPVYNTTGNNLWIKFKSDPSGRGSGFRATWNVACGGTFTNSTGVLRSPYFPNPYPNDKECIYVIRQPEGAVITLVFISFDIEGSATCLYDFLEVRSGETADGTLIGRYCGSSVPAPIQSPSNALWLKFKSDGSQQNYGFRATYSTSNTRGGCGGTLTSPLGLFHSPGHPNVYPHGVNCTWFIRASPGFIIRLTFMTFTLENNYRCSYDYVEIFDNYTSTNSLGRFCGTNTPPVMTSSENAMTIAFVTDNSLTYEGFSATYVTFNATTVCGGDLRSEAGVLTSPNYPANYPHNRICQWTITVPTGRQILLNITDFVMESHSSCRWDYLEIRNGGFDTSPLIGKYCGTTIDRIIQSASNRLFLKMGTDYSLTYRGFQIYYDGTISGCGGDMMAVTGSFTSPNYPLVYAHNVECFWQIIVAQGSTVNLHFTDFEMEAGYNNNCYYDYVEIRDSGPLGPLLGRLCGTTPANYVQSRTNRMWIKMRTDYSVTGRGFHAVYFANCNNRLNSYTGVIESPNFPRPYPGNRDCTWVVETTQGNKINASFSHFELQPGVASCTDDYLELRDGQDARGQLIGRYCSQNSLPPDVSTTSRYLYIRFVSDNTVSRNGFRLEYVADGCGGILTGNTGGFTSLNYPQPYPHQRECIWTITVQQGSRVELTIQDFDLESSNNCTYDSLEVYGGIDITSPMLTQLCHVQNTSQIVTSTGNYMVVRFVSDVTESGRGFNATYRSLPGGCGGNFTARTGTIVSQNFPNAYPHNTDCLWTITVDPGRPVVLTFLDFDLERASYNSICRHDYVAVYESMNFNYSQLMIACGNALPQPSVIRSSSNQLFIRMRTDSYDAHRGFRATYKAGCGGTLSADVDGVLTSPGWPNHYEMLTNCTWIIQANHTGDRITLTFLHMELEHNNNNCSDDYVQVLEGNEGNAPEIGKYCGTTVPPAITSLGSALVVNFVTDASRQRKGFQATYTKSTSACGGDFTAEHGAFNSPRYPESYPVNVECVWTITSSPGNSLMLNFGFFNLEASAFCNNDYVEVRLDNSGGQVLGRYCGNQVPTNRTTGNRLWIKFKSNENIPGQGFMATYNSIYGGYIVGNTGQVASPLYPNNYPHSVDYTWWITADLGVRIQATFQEMAIEGLLPPCSYDFVRLRDGNSADSLDIGTFCGTTIPAPVVTSSNQLRVEFHSDSSVNDRGFLLSWQPYDAVVTLLPPITLPPGISTPASVPGCGGVLNGTDTFQVLQSPGYPNIYLPNLNCYWTIFASPENRLLLKFNSLSLPGYASRCYYAQVVIRDGNFRMMMMMMIDRPFYSVHCGVITPQDTILMSNTAFVQFRSGGGVGTANFSGFSLSYKSVCGNIISTRQGSFRSPGYPNNYPDNSNCTWTIVVQIGRTVSTVFNGAFSINGQPGQCGGDYIEVFNGGNVSSPSLGRFCGNQRPTIADSSSNRITFNFVSNSDGITGTGFNVSFSEVQLACGGSTVLTESVKEVIIASPNYPQLYPPNVDCVWIVIAPANRRIRVDFTGEFSIEYHPDCQRFDFLELRDGGTANARLLGRFCGSNIPSTQEATGNVLYARFLTDNSVPKVGFRARVSYDICGGSVSAANGSISSPNFPANYPPNIDCEWFIRGLTGHYLTFTFETLNLEYNSNCSAADYVEVREYNSTGNILLTACGRSRPSATDTSDSFAYVKFHSNNQQTSSGFKMNFVSSIEVCGGQLTTPYGTITSPGYPRAYAHSRVCDWSIRVPDGRKVTLVFNDMDMEVPRHPRFCGNDYVEVRNGYLPMSPMIGRYCGQTLPLAVIESSSNTMGIQFRTDHSINGRGFSASYSSNSPSECGGILNGTDNSGIIESPGFSDNITYNASEQCIWVVANRNPNSAIAIRFLTLDVETQGECMYDFVEIREGSDENGQLIDRFCRMGRSVPSVILSPQPSLWIRFVSDFIIHRTGFQLSYLFTGCGGLLSASNGVITSPNFPSNYASNTYCAWKIVAPEGFQIKITILELSFNPATQSNCSTVYLEVFNGGLYSSPSAVKYCSRPASVFRSQSNEVRLVFQATATAVPARGFRLSYTFESRGCGGSIHSQAGVITSPNWPSNYNASQECIWEVEVASGYHIKWQFTAPFDLEFVPSCSRDYIEILELLPVGPPTWIGRYCGNQLPSSGSVAGNRMRIIFRSNANNQGSGFALNFTSGCGATYTGTQGVIVSPGYPNNYANNLNCTYDIVGDPQKYLYLTFDPDHFHVEGWRNFFRSSGFYPWAWSRWFPGFWGRRCFYDYVEVSSVINSTRQRLGTFCGSTAPQPIGSFGGLSIRFRTDNYGTDSGWMATYEQSLCGGRLSDPDGTITSPSHPQRYISNANCTWTITVSANKIIRLSFLSFALEPHSSCNYDYVAIYDGSSIDSSRLIGKYCGSALPAPVRSSGNTMLINFVSDNNNQREGFSAVYSGAYGPSAGCGGFLNSTSGSIRSIDANRDGIYETDLDCLWQFTVPQNSSIFIQPTQFNLSSDGCRDYLEVRDGLFESDPLVGRFCGSATPGNFTSTTNMLYVRFVTDSAIGASGFTLQYSTVPRLCGTSFYSTATAQILTSPNYPVPYAANLDCRWMIDAPTNEQVEVTVLVLDIDNRTNCDNGYLEIRDTIVDPYLALQVGSTKSILVCGNTIPQTYISHSQTVTISFVTQEGGSGQWTGFRLSYKTASCNQTYTASSGFLVSPRYPANYPVFSNCHTIIQTSPGYKLALFFYAMDIERNDQCRYDYLQVLNGSELGSSSVAKLCGRTIPHPIFLRQNAARLVFVTDGSQSHRGFGLMYTASASGCGGDLTSPVGVFASPDYPDNINYSIECRWSIAVSPRRTVVFSLIVQQSRSPTFDCTFSSLTVYDGPNTSSPSSMYCTVENIAPFRASSNRILVVYRSSNATSAANIAFQARYTSS